MSQGNREPDLGNHKALWFVVNACAMVLHVALSSVLWHNDLNDFPDDFYFFFFLFMPWCGIGGANIGFLVLACIRRSPNKLIWLHSVLVVCWITVALVEQRLMRIPQGVIDIRN